MAFYTPYNRVTLRHFSIFHRRIATSATGRDGMLFGRFWTGLRARSPATTKAAALPSWILPLSQDRVPSARRFLQHVPRVEDDKVLATHSQDSETHQETTTETTASTVPPVSEWKCVRCDVDFGSREELRLHSLASDRHFTCKHCVENGEWQDFLTKRKLRGHVRRIHRDVTASLKKKGVGENDAEAQSGKKNNKESLLESIYKAKDKESISKAKRRETQSERKAKRKEKNKTEETKRETPLDRFFTSFEGFSYDAHLSPEASFKSLKRYKGWKKTKDDGPGKDAWRQYQKALVEEVEMWFGNEKDLTAWWTLCKAVGCYDPPGNIRKCRAILQNTHVNIVDLIDQRRKGGDEEAAENEASSIVVFKSVDELKEYTKRTGKVFPMREMEEYNGGNVVLKHLLRHIFN